MTERLESAGVITVLVHRIKNLCAPRRSTHSASDKLHGITKFGRVPEKVVKDLGLSHHGRHVHFSPLLPLRLISCPVSTGRSKKNAASDRSATTPSMAEKTSMLSQSFTSSTGRWVSHSHSIVDPPFDPFSSDPSVAGHRTCNSSARDAPFASSHTCCRASIDSATSLPSPANAS